MLLRYSLDLDISLAARDSYRESRTLFLDPSAVINCPRENSDLRQVIAPLRRANVDCGAARAPVMVILRGDAVPSDVGGMFVHLAIDWVNNLP